MPEPHKNVRVCGDFKVIPNCCLETNHYHFPFMEGLLVIMPGSKRLTLFGVSSAYQQLLLYPEAQSLAVYTCLPYGLTSAPSSFEAVFFKRACLVTSFAI